MGRHRKPQPATTRRNSSVLALTGLVPVGLVAVTAVTDIGASSAATASVQQQLPENEEPTPVAAAQQAAAPAIDIDIDAENVMAKPSPNAPVVMKSVALADDRVAADLPDGPLDIPGIAVAAYKNAESILATENPGCAMPWSLLAGIGRVESTHAHGKADADGYPLDPVYGPVLDGSLAGNRTVGDTDGGVLDGLSGYDRAVGPMQFLPQTWEHFGADGNGDGIADPQNLYDAALTSGRYLCDGGLDMRDLSQQTKAILRYNNSMAYVANVMAWETGYGTGVAPRAAELPKI